MRNRKKELEKQPDGGPAEKKERGGRRWQLQKRMVGREKKNTGQGLEKSLAPDAGGSTGTKKERLGNGGL